MVEGDSEGGSGLPTVVLRDVIAPLRSAPVAAGAHAACLMKQRVVLRVYCYTSSTKKQRMPVSPLRNPEI